MTIIIYSYYYQIVALFSLCLLSTSMRYILPSSGAEVGMVGRLGARIGTRTGADGDGDDRINTIKLESSSLLRGTTTKTTTTTTTTMIVAGTNKEETEAKEEEKQQQQPQPQPHRMLQRPNHPCLLVRVETEFMRTVDNPLAAAAAATAAATATTAFSSSEATSKC